MLKRNHYLGHWINQLYQKEEYFQDRNRKRYKYLKIVDRGRLTKALLNLKNTVEGLDVFSLRKFDH